MIGIEREYIRFQNQGGQLIEHRFRSSLSFSKTDRFYGLASDPVAVERCRKEALKTMEERAAEKAASDAKWERLRPKEIDIPIIQAEALPPPPPVRKFKAPSRGKPMMPPPRRIS